MNLDDYEYMKQLILLALTKISQSLFNKLKMETSLNNEVLKNIEKEYNIESIIHCLQSILFNIILNIKLL